MTVETVEYWVGSVGCRGTLVYDDKVRQRRPLLLMAPNWLGVTKHAIDRAAEIASDKYIALVADMYGAGKIATGPQDASALANSLRSDTPERRRRICAALEALQVAADERAIGDRTRTAAVGFCFGGGNVLELARTGADLQAVICVHGDLLTPLPAKVGQIKAPIFVLHGSKDPVVPKEHRDKFESEMEAAGAKWQMLVFGGLLHSFSEAESDVPGIAQYDPGAARQAYAMIDGFATAAFDGNV